MKLEIGNTVFQPGRPKVAVSLTGRTPEEIVRQCEEAVAHNAEVIEWRADYYFSNIDDIDAKLTEKELYIEIVKIIDDINLIAEGRPVIFTIRSEAQGGLGKLNEHQITTIQGLVAEVGYVDLIDIEVAGPNKAYGGLIGEKLEERVNMVHEYGSKVILSYHDFNETPKAEDVVRLIMRMYGYKGDMFKVAVMANDREDALGLLKATAYLTKKEIGPVVTMAMGKDGEISRIVGGKYGSAITFAALDEASAPGQMHIDKLIEKLDEFYTE